MTYLALDPGTQMGWARSETGRVLDCGLAHMFDDFPCSDLPSCENGIVVIEEPVFRQGQNKVDPNDLIALGIKVGRATERYLTLGNKVETVTPSSWKGSTPKHIQEERTEAAFDDAERAMVLEILKGIPRTYQHNVWDALGILVWKLKKEKLR